MAHSHDNTKERTFSHLTPYDRGRIGGVILFCYGSSPHFNSFSVLAACTTLASESLSSSLGWAVDGKRPDLYDRIGARVYIDSVGAKGRTDLPFQLGSTSSYDSVVTSVLSLCSVSFAVAF